MQIFSDTNIGLARTENQDRVRTSLISDDIGFAVICDGMGGQNAGSEASERAVNVVFDRITKVFRPDYSENSIRNLFISSVVTANSVVYDMSISSLEMKGMGTTCVAALVCGNKLYAVNVGDSRLYLINHEIRQLSKDHTVVMRMYENGEITKEQIKNHPKRNYITKAVGVAANISPDYIEASVTKGSTVLLCSDGLSNYCDETDMFSIVKKFSIKDVPSELIKKALENGGGDNITAAVININ